MNTCEVQDVASLRPADHISIWDTSRCRSDTRTTASCSRLGAPRRHLHRPRLSQADSKFQLTSLTEFLDGRPLPDMRRVQYNSSLVAEASSLLGEVNHRTHADAPPVVLARCRFLLGPRRGLVQTALSRTETKVPFLTASTKSAQALERLQLQLLGIREVAKQRNKKLEDLTGKRVYLQLKDTGKFAKRFGEELYLKDWAFPTETPALRLGVRVQAYNCVRVEFEDYEKPGHVLYASSTLVPIRTGMGRRTAELTSQTLVRRRADSRGLLRPFISRDKAATFEIVDADDMDAQSPVIEPSSSDSEDSSYPTAPVIKKSGICAGTGTFK
ncbi:hypothetical protein GQ600_3343 [Phytophthora cactorum]|nr:hypothetical protein GQ600_3343 [Phytophthora cactorum]